MERHKYADVIIAWANGEVIQHRPDTASQWKDWINTITPGFGSGEWRVKPKPVVLYGRLDLDEGPMVKAYHAFTLSRLATDNLKVTFEDDKLVKAEVL